MRFYFPYIVFLILSLLTSLRKYNKKDRPNFYLTGAYNEFNYCLLTFQYSLSA